MFTADRLLADRMLHSQRMRMDYSRSTVCNINAGAARAFPNGCRALNAKPSGGLNGRKTEARPFEYFGRRELS
eukprot:8426189-Pyramimonas_sp.AAC.1